MQQAKLKSRQQEGIMTRKKVTKRGKSGRPRKYVGNKPPRGRGRGAVRCGRGGPKNGVVVTKKPPKLVLGRGGQPL